MIFDAPWIAVAFIESIFAVILVISLIILRRYRLSHLSNGAIKETVDMLPVGICFAKEDGTVVLKNLLADSICRELTGGALTDLDRFWTQIEAAGEKQNQVSIVVLPSGKTVMFQRCDIEVDSERFIQLIACDISEQYRITVELRDKNHKLLDIQQRMKAFGEMSMRLAMTEEILRARVSIHDEMGHLLLSGKYCLDRPETADRDNLLRLERYTHLLLMHEGEEPDDALPTEDPQYNHFKRFNSNGELKRRDYLKSYKLYCYTRKNCNIIRTVLEKDKHKTKVFDVRVYSI